MITKGLILLFILTTGAVMCRGQNNVDSVNYGTFKKFIMIDVEVFTKYARHGCRNSGLILKSKKDSIFCNASSTVCAVFDLGECVVVVTRDESNIFYTFSSLKEVVCKKGKY